MKCLVWGVRGALIAALAGLVGGGCSSDSDGSVGGDSSSDSDSNSDSGEPTGPASGSEPEEMESEPAPFNGQAFDPGDTTARPSEGCGSPRSLELGTQFLDPGASAGRYLLTAPANYDPDTAYPVFFVFHGANNSEADCRGGGNCQGVARALERGAFVVYQKAVGTSWTTDSERDQNVANFDGILDLLAAGACIDEGRVTAMGTSSGAHFTNILACRRGDRLQAVVPGAGEMFEREGCVGEVAALVIHGIDDTSVLVELGEAARDSYAERNGCSTETSPTLAEVRASVEQARADAKDQTTCADYAGCRAGLSVRWCEHSVPGYDDSTHGWPPSGGPLALEFVTELAAEEAP